MNLTAESAAASAKAFYTLITGSIAQNGVIARDSMAASFRFLQVLNGANLSLDALTLTNGETTSSFGGGAILVNIGGGHLIYHEQCVQ